MRKLILYSIVFLMLNSVYAQSPLFFKYQAVARDASGTIMAGKAVKFQMSVLKNNSSGQVVYSEIHNKTTNLFGLVDLEIGNGTQPLGDFSKIDWGADKYFIKVEMDPSGGTVFQNLGTSQLLSVPYALYARNVQNNNDADADSTNELQKIVISGNVVTLTRGGGSFTLPTALPGDDWGKQTVVTDSTMTGTGTATTPLKLAQRGATSGQVLKWNGTTWKPAADETASGSGGASGPAGGDLTGTYPNPVIGSGKVTSAKITDGTIQSTDLADSAVTTARIYPRAVTTSRIDTGAVTTDRIASSAISSGKLANNSVTASKLASMGAVSGQVLKWNGTGWGPSDDLTGGGGGFSLPYSETVTPTYAGFSITNTGSNDLSTAIYGFSSSPTRLVYGVKGVSASMNGTGVFGEASALEGMSTGVYGISSSISGRGVVGFAEAISGSTSGVLGINHSTTGRGVWRISESESGAGYGVAGSSRSPEGYGIYGAADHVSGQNFGILGSSKSRAGTGVYGVAESTSGTTVAIKGKVASPGGFSGHFTGGKFFVDGKVGIGTENPGAKLEVSGQVKITGGNPGAGKILASDADGLASWVSPFSSMSLPFYGATDSDSAVFKIVNTSTNTVFSPVGLAGVSASSSGTGVYGMNTAAEGLGRGVMGEVASPHAYSGYFTGGRFYVNGNVGIGTKAPNSKLEVVGDKIAVTNVTGSAYMAMRTDDNTGFVNLYYRCANMMIRGSAPGENLLIHPGVQSKVGIRTWTPVFDLDVNGDIRATGSVYYGGESGSGTATPYTKPDYVFDETYPYLPVNKVEEFLSRENHLPWVTSAEQEKKENGETTNMTRMAFETLESVENLQLQIIEQQKLIRSLSEQNERLAKENSVLKQNDDRINARLDRLEKNIRKNNY